MLFPAVGQLSHGRIFRKGRDMNHRIAGFTCCSNALPPSMEPRVRKVGEVLACHGIETRYGPNMFSDCPWGHGSARERARQLMDFFRDPAVTEIYDLSGGDLANGILPYLDYDVIHANPKPFSGYSDLTTVLNAIYAKTGLETILWQARNLINDSTGAQLTRFGTDQMTQLWPYFIRGKDMEGTLVGGNIRCFLKLAGTEYFPDLTGKILLLEARGGEVPQMMTYLAQLEQLGAFRKVRGILLGTFTAMERSNEGPSIQDLVLSLVPENLPVAVTEKIGHGTDSKAARIGGYYRFPGNNMKNQKDFL